MLCYTLAVRLHPALFRKGGYTKVGSKHGCSKINQLKFSEATQNNVEGIEDHKDQVLIA